MIWIALNTAVVVGVFVCGFWLRGTQFGNDLAASIKKARESNKKEA